MRARFLHIADCHLGYKQYGNKERYNDFARAFFSLAEVAVEQRVDFVVLAGDLFHKRSIDALTLNQAIRGLERLRDAGIPCLAVEGNHEHAYYQDTIGWMEFLALQNLIVLLNGDFQDGAIRVEPHKGRQGAYIDPMPGLRVFGMRYLGAATNKALEAYAQALSDLPDENIEYTIFMAHAGLEGVLADQAGGVSYRQWALLQPHVDYLALGHVHQPFAREDWIYNPGSPETCATVEAEWPERGYYLVDVDTDNGEAKHTATLGANRRRPFHRLRIKVDPHASPDALYDYCGRFLERRARDLGGRSTLETRRPVVELQLTGTLPFERSVLEIERLQTLVEETFDPLLALVRNLSRSIEFGIEVEEGVNRRALEQQVITELLERDARYHSRSEAWAKVVVAVKSLALENAGPDTIVEELAAQAELIAQTAVEPSAAETAPEEGAGQ